MKALFTGPSCSSERVAIALPRCDSPGADQVRQRREQLRNGKHEQGTTMRQTAMIAHPIRNAPPAMDVQQEATT